MEQKMESTTRGIEKVGGVTFTHLIQLGHQNFLLVQGDCVLHVGKLPIGLAQKTSSP